jgi:hypothetical protein
VTAKVVLVAVCGVGLVVAAVIAARWGSLRHDEAEPRDDAGTARAAILRVLRSLAIAVAGGGVAGVLVGGCGGRLLMRLLAATSGPAAQGLTTQADETVGEVTLSGTLGLMVFGGLLAGVAGGVVYVAIRRWLPSTAWLGGLVFGFLILAMARPLDLLDPGNVDFTILRPKALAVPLLAAIPLVYGVVLGALVERLDRGYPLLAWRPAAVAAYLPFVVFLLPQLAAGLIVVLLAAVGVQRAGTLRRWWSSTAVDRGGRAVLVGAGLAGTAWITTSVVDIFTI